MVQRLWYYFLRTYVWLGLHFYFRKIIMRGRENIPSGPVIFASNHQNAFLDAFMIVCFNSHFTYSLTRADIFKKPLMEWLLTTLNMLPIYRIRDGWQSLSENQKTFDICEKLFLKNGAIVIFPEGNHGGQRRLRPLSKGFTRLAFETLQKHADVKISIVPVGINYSDPQAFRSSVSVYFGKAISANEYFREPLQQHANQLRNDLATSLKQLITHVEDAGRYDEVIQKLERTHPNYLDPDDTNKRISSILNNEVIPIVQTKREKFNWPLTPLYYLASIINFVPLSLWGSVRKKIKDHVFIASIKLTIGIFMFPFYYLLIGWVFYLLFGSLIAITWWVVSFPSTLFLKKV